MHHHRGPCDDHPQLDALRMAACAAGEENGLLSAQPLTTEAVTGTLLERHGSFRSQATSKRVPISITHILNVC